MSELEADTFLAGSFVTMTSLKLSVQNVGFGSDVRCRSFKLAVPSSKSRHIRVMRFVFGLLSLAPFLTLAYDYYYGKTSVLRFDLSILCVLSFFARSVYGKMPYEESLLVTQKLGVQIERVYFSGRRSYEFVDIDTIEDVIINEGITRCKIVYYMAFLLSTKDDPLVVFENHPRRKVLETICHGTREVLGQGQ